MPLAVYPFVVSEVNRVTPKGSLILDVGCGWGQYRDSFPGYVGLDVRPEVKPDILKAIEYYDPPTRYRTIMLVGTLHELGTLREKLERCCKLIDPNGTLLVFDYQHPPNRRSGWHFLGLSCVLEASGFAVVRDRSFVVWPWWHWKRLAYWFGFRGTWLIIEARKT